MTTDKRNFDEKPQLTNQTDKAAEESAETEDEMAEELAMQEAGSDAAVPEPQPIEPENPESFADDIPFEGDSSERHYHPGQHATGSIFGSFGAIQATFPSGRTQLRSGLEEADWFNQFRERLAQSYSQPPSGEVETFGAAEAAEVPVHQTIAEDDTTDNTDNTEQVDDDDNDQLE